MRRHFRLHDRAIAAAPEMRPAEPRDPCRSGDSSREFIDRKLIIVRFRAWWRPPQ